MPDPTLGLSPELDPRSIAAMSQLCELVRRFNHRSFAEVIAFDWSGLPRCIEYGLDDLDPAAHELVRQKCRLFLEAAIGELEPIHPNPVGDVSPIQILRRHVLDGDTWEVILAERREQGLPRISERTLKNRQHEGYHLILQWSTGRVGKEKPQLDIPFSRRRERIGRAARWVGGGILAVLIAWGLTQLRPQPGELGDADAAAQMRAVSGQFLGIQLGMPGGIGAAHPLFMDVLPDFELPELPKPAALAMLLPVEGRNTPALLLATDAGGEGGGKAWLWDPIEGEFLWTLAWEPPSEKVRTHETLTEPIQDEPWGIRGIAYRGGATDLGEQVLLLYMQRYSPCFALFVDRSTGEPRAHYAHPGQLSTPLIADLNQDGLPEALLAGTDNVENRAVLVVLDPRSQENGAASTVMWNSRGEGALFRVLHPPVPELEEFHGYPRHNLKALRGQDWNPQTRILVTQAYLPASRATTYTTYLRDGWIPIEENPVLQGYRTQELMWDPAGVEFSGVRGRLIEQIEVVAGIGFGDWQRSARTSPSTQN